MNDSQVKQQIQQMVSFIRQEAEEKAAEIGVKAEEDFNIRKLSTVEAAREKIRAEYERKTKLIQVNRKMYVAGRGLAVWARESGVSDGLGRLLEAERAGMTWLHVVCGLLCTPWGGCTVGAADVLSAQSLAVREGLWSALRRSLVLTLFVHI